ncbi:MAG: ribonuclease HI [Alphaproteobacteria bacterium GM202ARS2]|nr:ribonuclease HI [Alphaproteobacteria bacterium GM202ARS2]
MTLKSNDDVVTIFTDGACSGNPGVGGWAATLRWRGTTRELSGAHGDTTNNRMELTAAIRALQSLDRPSSVHLYSDSRYVQQGITQWLSRWKSNGWRTTSKQDVKNVDLWRELDSLNARHTIRWHWLKGHAGQQDNERVDRLARDAIKAHKKADKNPDAL